MFHKFAVWSYINEQERKCTEEGIALTEKESNKQKELSLKYKVFNKYTAFICVLQENDLTEEEMILKQKESIKRNPGTISLQVKTLQGDSTKVTADVYNYIEDVSNKALAQLSLSLSKHTLVLLNYRGHKLDLKKRLIDYKIPNKSDLHLILRLAGGGRSIFINLNGQKTKSFIPIEHNQTQVSFPFIINTAVKLVKINKENYDFFFENENITNNTNSYTFNNNSSNNDNDYTLDIFSRDLGNKIGVNLVKNQLMNGLWVVNENNLKLISFNLQKFKTLKQQLNMNPFNKYNNDDCLFNCLDKILL